VPGGSLPCTWKGTCGDPPRPPQQSAPLAAQWLAAAAALALCRMSAATPATRTVPLVGAADSPAHVHPRFFPKRKRKLPCERSPTVKGERYTKRRGDLTNRIGHLAKTPGPPRTCGKKRDCPLQLLQEILRLGSARVWSSWNTLVAALPFSFSSERHSGVSERAAPTDLVVAANKLGVGHGVALGLQNVA
jgi:hypothetical protein